MRIATNVSRAALRDAAYQMSAIHLLDRSAAARMFRFPQNSWLEGNSLPHTLMECMYAHPAALNTMREMTGWPVAPVVIELASPASGAEATKAVVAPLVQPPLRRGSLSHALLASLLALVTGTLKGVALAHSAINAAGTPLLELLPRSPNCQCPPPRLSLRCT